MPDSTELLFYFLGLFGYWCFDYGRNMGGGVSRTYLSDEVIILISSLY